jgi:hypothetical protein
MKTGFAGRLAVVLGMSTPGCDPHFAAYNELESTRVLAVRAQPAELTEGASSLLDALIYRDHDEAVEQTWSWCPWSSDPNGGFRCPVDQALLNEAWKKAGLAGSAPALELGRGETSSLSFPGTTAQARALCEALGEAQVDSFLEPNCEARWEWSVRLSLHGKQTHIETIKSVALLLDPKAAPNQNPELTSFAVEAREQNGQHGQKPVTLDSGAAAELAAGQHYDLTVKLAADAAEIYQPVPVPGQTQVPATREALTLTWFVDAGSTDHVRTTYAEGVESLHDATRNSWSAPDKPEAVKLFVVVRDHRGGVDFRAGTIQLVGAGLAPSVSR